MDECVNKWMDGWMVDRWMSRGMKGGRDKRVDGRMCESIDEGSVIDWVGGEMARMMARTTMHTFCPDCCFHNQFHLKFSVQPYEGAISVPILQMEKRSQRHEMTSQLRSG